MYISTSVSRATCTGELSLETKRQKSFEMSEQIELIMNEMIFQVPVLVEPLTEITLRNSVIIQTEPCEFATIEWTKVFETIKEELEKHDIPNIVEFVKSCIAGRRRENEPGSPVNGLLAVQEKPVPNGARMEVKSLPQEVFKVPASKIRRSYETTSTLKRSKFRFF